MPRVNVKSLSKARKKLKKDGPIVRTKTGLITKKNTLRVINRWSKQKGYTIESPDKIIRNVKNKGKFLDINSVSVTARLAQRDLLNGLKSFKLKKEEILTIERLLSQRIQKIPNTNINIRQETPILYMKLLNQVGEKKTNDILRKLNKRSIAIRDLSQKEIRKKNVKSDVFINISQIINPLMVEFEMEMYNKNDFLKRINSLYKEKLSDIEQIKSLDIPNKKTYETILRNQLKEIVFERVKFCIDHNLHV